MANKEIVFISNFIGNGGAARVITNLAESFANKGYDVSICSFLYNGMEYQHSQNVEYIYLETKNSGLRNKIERIKLIRNVLKSKPRASIIAFEYFINMQTIVASFGLKNQIIVSERNDPARVGGNFPTKQIRNFLYRFCDILVCQTPDAKSYFPTKVRKHSVVIANPIKGDLPERWTGNRREVIVNFCRLEKQKNLTMLIDAFQIFQKNHNNYELVIYGDGKEKDSLQNYIQDKKLQDSVAIKPAVSDIHDKVIDSRMFVSSSDYEGLSNSMIEAMAIGLPTICTDCPCGGARMLIKDGVNGLLSPVGESAELAKKMELLLDDEYVAKLSDNAIKINERLSLANIVEDWENILVFNHL